jgi:hypothetical protein
MNGVDLSFSVVRFVVHVRVQQNACTYVQPVPMQQFILRYRDSTASLANVREKSTQYIMMSI